MLNAMFDLLGTVYQRGDLAQAESIALSIRRIIPDDTVSLQFLGLVYYRTRRRGDAVQAFNRAAGDGHPRGTPVGVASSLRASIQCLRAASGYGSALSGAWYDLGLVLFRLRRYQQAISAMHSALAARRDFPAAQRAITRITEFSYRQRTRQTNHDVLASARGLTAGSGLGRSRIAGQFAGQAEHSSAHSGDRQPLGNPLRRHLPHGASSQNVAHTVSSGVPIADGGKKPPWTA
jgi:tetratricopeptide (TPR) repeat protein